MNRFYNKNEYFLPILCQTFLWRRLGLNVNSFSDFEVKLEADSNPLTESFSSLSGTGLNSLFRVHFDIDFIYLRKVFMLKSVLYK